MSKKYTYPYNPIYNATLGRTEMASEIRNILGRFSDNIKNLNYKKGIYIYGSPGCGKTQFIMDILESLNYDIIQYDAGDVRNKSLIDTITSNNIASQNVLSMMRGETKKIAIVMDEIDGMNNGDKGGITALIKIIRQKKTKKQRLENMTLNPIICIGNYYIDKKIKELMKVCYTFELATPTRPQIARLLSHTTSYAKGPKGGKEDDGSMESRMLDYIQGDLRKLAFVQRIYMTKPHLLCEETMASVFQMKSYNDDAKKITRSLIDNPVSMSQHNRVMNETDRTIVALLWHENIVDSLEGDPINCAIPFYLRFLNNMCFADYIDRITFQHQIWSFNEMSSLTKTFYNNRLFHQYKSGYSEPICLSSCKPVIPSSLIQSSLIQSSPLIPDTEVRFTKVLTKYSTEYNNLLFIYNLCKELDMDKKDLIALFQELRLFYGKDFYNQPIMTEIEKLFENYNISKLDIKRMYRYLDKNVKKEGIIEEGECLSDIDD